MKKLYYLIVLALILGLVLTGCSLLSNVGQVPATEQIGVSSIVKNGPPPGSIYIDFESTGLNEGKTVEGEGTVHPLLNIELDSKTLILLNMGTSFAQYTAYKTTPDTIYNGCLNGDYGFGCPTLDSDGKIDFTNALGNEDEIVFTFPSGVTVSYFSIMMFDYGDWYPSGSGTPKVKLTDNNGNIEEYLFPGSPGTDYDACEGSNGRKKLEISEIGISTVTLSFEGEMDPGVGFDDIYFTLEPVCNATLIAGQNEEVGEVTVKLSGGSLEVTYNVEAPWKMEEIHFHASFLDPEDWSKPVVNKAGNPAPGQFLKVEDLGGLNTYSFEIPLSEIGTDDDCGSLYFAAHAKVYWIDDSVVPIVLKSEAGSDEVYLFIESPNAEMSNFENQYNLIDYPTPSVEVNYDNWSPSIVETAFGAKWISDDQPWSSDPYITWWGSNMASWRKFERTINIPSSAVNIQAISFVATADNEEDVYINGSQLTPSIGDSTNWTVTTSYDLPLATGNNTMEILVKNISGTGFNPTGLIYKLEYQYELKIEETAWGKGVPFPNAKNWSMYFHCPDFVIPCE